MQLTGIEIKNFRGFDSLRVDDFGQLNLIVGQNNVGKTALLEALTLCVASIEPEVILTLNKVREISDSGIDSFRSFFYNLVFVNSPVIKSTWHSKSNKEYSRSVQLIAKESDSYQLEEVNQTNRQSNLLTATPADSRVNQIDIVTKMEDSQEIIITIRFSGNGKGGRVDIIGKRDLSEAVIFLPSTTTQEPILQRVGYLKENRLEEPLVTLLSKIDSRIRGIEVIGNRLLLDVEDAAKLMPLGLLGDGVKKAMSIMASVIDTDSETVILVDEIENGLHYSVHQELWKALILVVEETRSQLFVTTHNLETLHYLNEALEEFPAFKEHVRCFDIAKTKNAGFQAYKYSYKGLSGALEKEIEIRR